ncbi:MAG: DUF72 domain-containing protein [Leptolyngbyaceae cyanobacterium bins.349]|nr:DUF72 domain-containing protein [Leptolyngbyaceae cyanobacterium bins.349]
MQTLTKIVMQNFWIGCALWGYKDWVGELFPSGSRSPDFLKLYGERLTAVEGNTTFYSVPDADTIARWAADTPPGFRFCPKFPQQITHRGPLQPKIQLAQQFITQMQGLGDRLGPLFAQLPPRYSPAQFTDLALFLTELAEVGVEIALEVRHLDWFQAPHRDRLHELLIRLQMGRVLLDTRPIYDVPDDPQLEGDRKKPRVPVDYSITANFSLIRYISHPHWELNLPFLQDWKPMLNQALQQHTRIYLFVHCPVEARSPANARSLHQWLGQQGAIVPPLPWNQLTPPPAQLTLL